MENPASWPDEVKVIAEAIESHAKACKEGVYGYSVMMTIYRALKEAGHIKEEDERSNTEHSMRSL